MAGLLNEKALTDAETYLKEVRAIYNLITRHPDLAPQLSPLLRLALVQATDAIQECAGYEQEPPR